MDEILCTKIRQIEKKEIKIEHRRNANGEFVRCTETMQSGRYAMNIPLVGLHDVIADLDDILRTTLIAAKA